MQHRRIKTLPDQSFKSFEFSYNQYDQEENPQSYLQNLLMKACKINKISTQKMSIKQLSIILNSVKIVLKNVQLHEVYLYATYQNTAKSQRKVRSIVNIQTNKINISSVVKWLNRKLQNSVIQQPSEIIRSKTHKYTKSCHIRNQKTQSQIMLPSINAKPKLIFENEIKNVLVIFSKMEKQRQNAGLEAVSIQSDNEQQIDHNEPTRQKHYEGQFFEINQKLSSLKSQAHRRIQKVIQATKYDKKLKLKFQQALMKYQKVRSQANQKMGKRAAMKAQKRINDKQKQQIKLLQKWRQQTNQTQFATKYY